MCKSVKLYQLGSKFIHKQIKTIIGSCRLKIMTSPIYYQGSIQLDICIIKVSSCHFGSVYINIVSFLFIFPELRASPGCQYSCEFCGRVFSNRALYKRHVVIHTGEKEFHCNICYKSFNRKWNLKSHMMLHIKEAQDLGQS